MLRSAIWILVTFLSGCAGLQGGMPNVPFNVEQELGIVSAQLRESASVKIFYDAPSYESRNKFIASRLVITNIEYLKFIKSLSAEETQIHSATDMLVLTLDVVSAAVIPVNTKSILSGLSAIAGGVRLSIDKNVYYEKTMSALISSMNAQRKEVLSKLLSGATRTLKGYPFEQALSDINDYYLAGTIQGALAAIQSAAAVKEVAADAQIQKLTKDRDPGFVEETAQGRVDILLGAVDKLSDAALFELVKAPPVSDAFVDNAVAARDPKNLRLTDPKAAAAILKMRIVLSERDENSLTLWKAAVKSLGK